jgi:hypothetical protein
MRLNSLFLLIVVLIVVSCKKKEVIPDPLPGPTLQLLEYKIKPSQTNPVITTFDNEHFVYLDQRATAKNKLFVFFPGTFATPASYTKILQAAASYGYHVIGLMYQNGSELYSGCSFNADNNCFSLCRLEIYDGADRTAIVTVPVENSIKSRLFKLLQYLQTQYPAQNWQQFLNGPDVQWSNSVLSGHSQGGGHAAFIGKINLVGRVICFSSIDWNSLSNTSAAWVSQTGLTPANRYFCIHNPLDEIFAYTNTQQQWTQLGISGFGPIMNIDSATVPYSNTHTLITRALPSNTLITPNHNGTAVNSYIPQNGSGEINNSILKAWEYLFEK